MNNYCTKCGSLLKEGDNICHNCGNIINMQNSGTNNNLNYNDFGQQNQPQNMINNDFNNNQIINNDLEMNQQMNNYNQSKPSKKKNKTLIIVISIIIGIVVIGIISVGILFSIVWKTSSNQIKDTINESQRRAFEISATAIARYLEDQYQTYLIDIEATQVSIPFIETKMTQSDFEKAGYDYNDFSSGYWYIDETTERACVKLSASSQGLYSGLGKVKSKGCK